jgi:hypothetical protein
MEPNTESNLFDLQVDHEVTGYLGETARWAKFIAIIGFICCGLIAIFSFFIGSIYSSTIDRLGAGSGASTALSGGITVLYLAMAVVYFFPCLYLFRFAVKMQVALRSNDQPQLIQSFRNLKSCYKYMGILLIIVLGISVLAFILGIVAGAAFH